MSVGVVAACYKGIMGHKAAEQRLREVGAGSYLTRESDIIHQEGEIRIVLLV